MTIGEVASRAGIRASAIRYYERSGVLPPAARAGARRQYDEAVLKQLAVVILAREAGFTIREIRALFRDFSADATASLRWRT
ncbi:MAG: MerR family transcriptional regulator, partial [Candidatus Dormibacteria bacterium]